MPSILIPAHNEEAVIQATLQSVLASVGDAEVEILVVCNGCTDATFDRAGSVDARVQVIETTRAGKCAAMNLGEQRLQTFPRIYLDADIQVSPTLVADLFAALDVPQSRAAWPHARYDLGRCSWPVRAYYQVWTSLPYNRPGRIGVGVYAVNEAGRAKFGEFPEVISDDGYFRGLFEDEERIVLGGCHTVVQAPRDLKSLLAVRTRSRMGVYQLRSKYPEVMKGHYGVESKPRSSIRHFANPALWPALVVYAWIVLVSKSRAKQRLEQAGPTVWDRDLSARQASNQ